MATALSLKENYKNLSKSNQQTIFYMGKLIGEKGSATFKTGETIKFIEKVANELNAAVTTVRRLYYTYITKHSFVELTELGTYYNANSNLELDDHVIKLNKGKNKLLLFKNKMVPVYEEENKYFFVVDELLDALPISKTNKALKNSLAVKGRKILEINGEKQQCIEVEKVKTFLQSFLRQLIEGEQKDDIRFFLESVHQLSLKSNDIYAKPVVQELRPIPKENKNVIQKQAKVQVIERTEEAKISKTEKPSKTNVVKIESVHESKKQGIKPKASVSVKEFGMLKELKEEIVKAEKKKQETLLNIDETEEIKALTKILNTNIGYLSQEAKEKLYNLTLQNGLVNTVVATMGMLDSIQKDTSLYFVNKIEEELKVCL